MLRQESGARSELFMVSPTVSVYNDRDRLLSDVAEEVFARVPAVAIVAGFHYKVTSDGRMLLVVALKSRPDGADVAAIARRHGAGGHLRAAGFNLPGGDAAALP
jgi:nanoRNase/pAp phosphatase (c-di-AMP/oligoRNAs hydrolase)